MIKISIIIPVYNSEKYLADCLDSILDQNLEEIEIICVDDGSTDSSGEILSDYAKKDSRIIIITQKNSGQGPARNTGIAAASGEYLFFVDSDDKIFPNVLKPIYETVKKENPDMLLFNIRCFADPEYKEQIDADMLKRKGTYEGIVDGLTLMDQFLPNDDYQNGPCQYILRKSFCDIVQPRFLGNVKYEDICFTFQSMINAKRCVFIPLEVYQYRIRDGSTMRSVPTMKGLRGFYLSWLRMQEMISGRTDIAGHPAIPVLINYVRRDARRVYRELKKKNLLQCETDFDRVICTELQRENFYERLSQIIGLRAARRIDMFLNKYSCL